MPVPASESWVSWTCSFLSFLLSLCGGNRLAWGGRHLGRAFRWRKGKLCIRDIRREIPVAELRPKLWLALGSSVGDHQSARQRLGALWNPELHGVLSSP